MKVMQFYSFTSTTNTMLKGKVAPVLN